MTSIDDSSIDTLVARVEKLEVSRHFSSLRKKKSNDDDSDAQILVVDESMRRARQAVESSGIYSAQWAVVPQPDYYTWTLEERAECLGAPSIHYLCKSLLMENKKHTSMNNNNINDQGSVSDVTNPKFFLVVIQYASTLDVCKTINLLRSLRPVSSRLDASQFDLRIASPQDNDAITGYSHNSVTPFGLLRQNVPILLTDAVVPLKYCWMGGGAVHVKLRVAVADFSRSLPQVIVGDISRPRTGVLSANDLED